MSVFLKAGTPYYQFDFQIRGHRFLGSTKCTTKREAEAVENGERERAKIQLASGQADGGSLTIDIAAGRYWAEIGKHHACSSDTWRDIQRLVTYFGANKRLCDIADNEVAALVSWRRGNRVQRSKKRKLEDCPLISNATVNRSTTEVLKKLFTRAKAWGIRFDREPRWRAHMLAESEERIRELQDDEGERLEDHTREDYEPFFDFARAAGPRLRECLLRWSEVNFSTRQIIKRGKGGKTIVIPITPVVREILWPLQGQHKEFVFTYTAQRTRGERIKGERYPITFNGVKTIWKRIRKAAGVVDFRFHDFRHDLATKLLRDTGNLKLVQKALNHSDIKTTTRYAHVLTEEVSTALEAVQKSRRKSRSAIRKVS
jgi:integrase